MNNKKFLSLLFSIIILFSSIIIGVNYKVDPMQFYRKAEKYNIYFSSEQRYQNPGLAKNFDYDTIIIGTSMTENFLPSYVNKKLNCKTLKLSMEGSTCKEQVLLANLAIKTGKVKNIIWEINYSSLSYNPGEVKDTFPRYFYDKNPLNDIQYLLNIDTLNNSINIVKDKNIQSEEEKFKNLETLNNWGTNVVCSKEATLKNYYSYSTMNKYYQRDNIYNMEANVNKNITDLVEKNKNINFSFYYPPFSVLRHKTIYNENHKEFYNEIEIEKYIFNKIGKKENVKIYSFEGDKNITFNLNNYKDITHHSQAINNYIIDCISKNSNLVTEDNLEKNLMDFKNQVLQVSPKDL